MYALNNHILRYMYVGLLKFGQPHECIQLQLPLHQAPVPPNAHTHVHACTLYNIIQYIHVHCIYMYSVCADSRRKLCSLVRGDFVHKGLHPGDHGFQAETCAGLREHAAFTTHHHHHHTQPQTINRQSNNHYIMKHVPCTTCTCTCTQFP